MCLASGQKMLKLEPTARNAGTRSRLERGLMSLVESKPYDRITVRQLCAVARVGRSTFYAHFDGKDDVKRAGLEHLRASLVERTASQRGMSGEIFAFSLPMFQHARSHLAVYRTLVRTRGGNVALSKIHSIVTEVVRNEMQDRFRQRPLEQLELPVAYVVGAFMSLLISWLDAGARFPPERLDAMFRRLSTAGLQSYATKSEFSTFD
jgi:AcrR family transcriptional regulator